MNFRHSVFFFVVFIVVKTNLLLVSARKGSPVLSLVCPPPFGALLTQIKFNRIDFDGRVSSNVVEFWHFPINVRASYQLQRRANQWKGSRTEKRASHRWSCANESHWKSDRRIRPLFRSKRFYSVQQVQEALSRTTNTNITGALCPIRIVCLHFWCLVVPIVISTGRVTGKGLNIINTDLWNHSILLFLSSKIEHVFQKTASNPLDDH